MKYNHYKKRIVSFSEKSLEFHNYSHDDFIPPLRVNSVGKSRWGQKYFYERQESDLFGIEQVTTGNMVFVQEQKEYLVDPGEVFFLRKGCAHLYRAGSAGFVHKRYLTISGLALESILRSLGLWECDHLVAAHPARVAALLKKIYTLFAEKPAGFTETVSIAAYQLLCELGRRKTTRYPPGVTRAVEFINRTLDHSVSLADICQAAHTSSTHLIRLFKEYVGSPPLLYHRLQRISWAQHLLINTSMSIKEIADKTGFGDPLYFSAQFKKEAGVSPRAFRDRKVGKS